MRILGICLVLTFSLSQAPAAAGDAWVAVGPPGGDVRSLAADPRSPQVVFLGTAEGVLYRSDDAGVGWRRLEPGFPVPGMSLDDVAVDRHGRVFVGYWEVAGSGGGVARSDDGGRTFRLLPGIAGESVRALAVAASDPDVLVAGALSGVFRSDDGGAGWRRISPAGHADLRNVESVAVDPTDPGVMYAGTWHLAWKTVDGGRSWRPIHTGMIDDSDVFTLSFDPRSSRALFATACSGIYRSADGGAHWTKVRGIPYSARRTRAFAQDPARPDRLYAGTTEGLWASDDGGAGWRPLTSKRLVVNAVLLRPGGGLVLGTDGAGVLRSDDGGQTWSPSNAGFSQRFVSRVVFDPRGGRVLAAILGDRQHGGVLAAPGPAGPWRSLGPGLEGREVLSLALAGDTAFAGTDDGVFAFASGAWARLAPVVGGRDLHPRVADVVALPGGRLLAATSKGLLRSPDRGATWELHGLGVGGAVSALARAGELELVLAATPLGVFRSADGGASWTQVSAALAAARIHDLAFLPSSEQIVFAATPRGLFQSADQARTWHRVGGGLPPSDITGLALHPDGRTLFASDFTGGGVYRSDDAGTTWRGMGRDGLSSRQVWRLAVDPTAPERLIAATPSGGLHLLSPPVRDATAGSP